MASRLDHLRASLARLQTPKAEIYANPEGQRLIAHLARLMVETCTLTGTTTMDDAVDELRRRAKQRRKARR